MDVLPEVGVARDWLIEGRWKVRMVFSYLLYHVY